MKSSLGNVGVIQDERILGRELPISILRSDNVIAEHRSLDPGDAYETLRRLAPTHLGDDLPDRAEVENLLLRVRNRVAQIMSRCAAVDVFVAAQLDFSSTTDDVEAVYADLQRFCSWFQRIDEPQVHSHHAKAYFEYLHYACRRLIDAEQLLAHQVNQWLLFLQTRQGEDSSLRLFLTQVAAWHAHVHHELEHRKVAIERRLDSAYFVEEGNSFEDFDDSTLEIVQRADDLVKANELQLMPAFSALARLDRSLLIRFAVGDRLYRHHENFLHSLWSVVDLILIEEMRHEGASSSLFESLQQTPLIGQRMMLLRDLLAEQETALDASRLDSRFAAVEGVFEHRDRETVWRSLMIAHPQEEVRRAAAAIAPLDALWQVLAYPNAPLEALLIISEEVARRGDEDLHKVLFDCIKSRILSGIADVADGSELERLARFIMLFFRFEFFIQTRYFEQLETMLQLFRAQARRFDMNFDSFDREWQQLGVSRQRARSPEATQPKRLDRLPLPVQRHLAREGCYLTFFACHSNHLIAREVVHYLHADNLGRFLKLPELNRQMLEETLRKVDLQGRRDRILEVLVHPKCPMIFASRQLPQLGRSALHQIIQSRATHSEVKRKAMMLMIKLQAG